MPTRFLQNESLPLSGNLGQKLGMNDGMVIYFYEVNPIHCMLCRHFAFTNFSAPVRNFILEVNSTKSLHYVMFPVLSEYEKGFNK